MPVDPPADAYELLGVAEDASTADISRAYRRLARQVHPDAHTGMSAAEQARATARMAELNTARAVLTDPTRRAACDRARHASSATGPPPGDGATRTRPTGGARRSESPLTVTVIDDGPDEVAPGALVVATLVVDVPAGAPAPAGAPQVTTDAGHPLSADECARPQPHRSRLQVTVDTRHLGAHGVYRLPLTVAWGGATTTTILTVITGDLADWRAPAAPTRWATCPETPRWRRRWPFRWYARRQRLLRWTVGGVGMPLLLLAWTLGRLSVVTGGTVPAPGGLAAIGVSLVAVALLTGSSWAAIGTRGFTDPLAMPTPVAIVGGASLVLGVATLQAAKWSAIVAAVLAAIAVAAAVAILAACVATLGGMLAAAFDT